MISPPSPSESRDPAPKVSQAETSLGDSPEADLHPPHGLRGYQRPPPQTSPEGHPSETNRRQRQGNQSESGAEADPASQLHTSGVPAALQLRCPPEWAGPWEGQFDGKDAPLPLGGSTCSGAPPPNGRPSRQLPAAQSERWSHSAPRGRRGNAGQNLRLCVVTKLMLPGFDTKMFSL